MELRLPPCEWRMPTEDTARFYCRHGAIVTESAIVPGMVCRVCPVRMAANPAPRPELTPEQLRSAAEKVVTMPGLSHQMWNLGNALKDFVADGLKTVSAEEYQARLQVCESCEYRVEDRCAQCGCYLTLKARGRAFECPDGRWERTAGRQSVD